MRRKIKPGTLENEMGTAWRVLMDGNRIGIFQLFLYALSILTKPLDIILALAQGKFTPQSDGRGYPIIFISGYSRSGTTLVYQVLSEAWDVEYISNLVVLFPKSYILVTLLYRKLFGYRRRRYESYYGLTANFDGTNDGAHVYMKWHSESDYVFARPISDVVRRAISGYFRAITASLSKPLITKNCNIYQLYEQYADIFPEAHFIFVKREPVNIILSTLMAREFIQGDMAIRWEYSFKPLRNASDAEDPAEEVCRNIKYCYERMDEFSLKINPGRYHVVRYEEFCGNPAAEVAKLGECIFGELAPTRACAGELRPFKISQTPAKDDGRRKIIKKMVDKIMPSQKSGGENDHQD
jgi:hypothetical protein